MIDTQSSSKAKSFVTGAGILAAAGLLGKIIAAFYRVWLNTLIGPEGLGLYAIPYSYYTFLLTISTAGIPTAISRLISQNAAQGNASGAKEVFVVARRVLLLTGTVTTVLMIALCQPLAAASGEPDAYLGFITLAPSLLIVCMLSAYRGYFQGLQNMKPSAVSQIVEQIGRLAFGFSLAALWSPKGAAWGAAGAILGVTLCEAMALAFIFGSYRAANRKTQIRLERVHFRPVAVRISRIAIPVTIGACIMPLVSLTDTLTVINRLALIGEETLGMTPTAMFGILTGMVTSIINMPAVITQSLSISLVPAMTEVLAGGARERAASIAGTGVKLAILIGLPCAAGISLLADPIMAFLSPRYSALEHSVASGLLSAMAFSFLFLAISQTTTGILQGMGRPMLPVYALGVGAVFKIVLNFTLIALPGVNIYGAVIGSIVCYAVAGCMNIWQVVRHTGMRFEFGMLVLRPLCAALTMAATVYLANRLLAPILGATVAMLLCVGLGIAVYTVMLFVGKAVTAEDLRWIPGGKRLGRLLQKHIC